MAAGKRGSVSASTGDAIRAVAVLGGLLIAVALLFSLGRGGEVDPVPEAVEYESVVEYARERYPYRVLAPENVPENWRATSVDHAVDERGHRWRVGFVIEADGFVGLEQSDGETQSYLADRLGDYQEDGTVEIDGDTWQRYLREGTVTDRALVHLDEAVTIIRGTEPYEALAEFAGSLQ